MARGTLIRPSQVSPFECSPVFTSRMLLDHTNSESKQSTDAIVKGILAKTRKSEPDDLEDWEDEETGYEEQVIEDNKDRIRSALNKLGL